MTVNYQVALHNPDGLLQTYLAFESVKYTLSVNQIGALEIDLPVGLYPSDLFPVDSILAVYRSIDSGAPYLDGEALWFLVKSPELTLDNEGALRNKLTAVHANDLIRRRVVAYDNESNQANKYDYADDMIKEMVDENLGSTATNADRDLSAYLSVQPQFSLGKGLDKSLSFRNLMDAFQEIAADCYEQGTYLAFEIVAINPPGTKPFLEFQTFIGQRGIDRRISTLGRGLLIGPQYGNLADVKFSKDFSEEVNFAYALGQGQDDLREVQTASASARIAASPFRRSEGVSEAQDTRKRNAVLHEARMAIKRGKPKISFSGRLVDTPGFRYGIHYQYGDYLTVEMEKHKLDCRLNAVTVTLDSGGTESIEARLAFGDDE